MSTFISVRSTGVANIATAPAPASSIIRDATDSVSVRSSSGAVVVQGEPTETVVGTEPETLILQIATTSVSVISVNTGGSVGTGKADIINRVVDTVREVDEFEVMINHDILLDATSEILFNGTDGEMTGELFLL